MIIDWSFKQKRTRRLMTKLMQRGPTAYQAFRKSLLENEVYEHLVQRLDSTEIDPATLPVPSPNRPQSGSIQISSSCLFSLKTVRVLWKWLCVGTLYFKPRQKKMNPPLFFKCASFMNPKLLEWGMIKLNYKKGGMNHDITLYKFVINNEAFYLFSNMFSKYSVHSNSNILFI